MVKRGFRHAYMVISTDFEIEPVIEQYLATYPDFQPREYKIVSKLQNERVEGDYSYIIIYEFVRVEKRQHPNLSDYIKSYCEVNDKVANLVNMGSVFPDIGEARYGNPDKYRNRKE